METSRAEARNAMPQGLLTAISYVESGRWNASAGAKNAWPWTVTSGAEGAFFPTKAAAIAEVRRLQRAGVTNIDVGCMQINLRAHPEAFASLDAAFDPGANVAYAVDFLSRLHREFGTWAQAATAYHSKTPHLAARYRAKLMAEWPPARNAVAAMQADAGPIHLASTRPDRHPAEQAASTEGTDLAREAARAAADTYRRERIAQYLADRRGIRW